VSGRLMPLLVKNKVSVQVATKAPRHEE